MDENKKYIILKQHLAGWLMTQGFVLLSMSPTRKENSNRNVFVFKKTNSLLNKIEEYKMLHNN